MSAQQITRLTEKTVSEQYFWLILRQQSALNTHFISLLLVVADVTVAGVLQLGEELELQLSLKLHTEVF